LGSKQPLRISEWLKFTFQIKNRKPGLDEGSQG
jgi:hypothetical protein